VYRTPSLRGLSYRFAVRADDARLGRHVDTLFAALRDGNEDDRVGHWYSLTGSPSAPGGIDVDRDGEQLAAGLSPANAVGWVVWDVNRSAAQESGHLLFHAGALEADGLGVLLPGSSGSGKSTLSAGLAQRGLGYLSDELVAFDHARDVLLPYPKPITLKAGSFAVLPDLAPGPPGLDGPDAWPGEEWQIAVGEGTGLRVGSACPPGLVVVPRFEEHEPTSLQRVSDTEAFFSLAANAVNLTEHGAAGTEALGRIVTGSRCLALTFSDLDEACALVTDVVAELAVPRAG
jgi:hypothetical protein